jgi:hypothetical protein
MEDIDSYKEVSCKTSSRALTKVVLLPLFGSLQSKDIYYQSKDNYLSSISNGILSMVQGLTQ